MPMRNVTFENDPLPVMNEGERHIACVVAVDTSGSTAGEANRELNRGLGALGMALSEDKLAEGRADIAVISFNSTVQTEMSMRPAKQYEAPVLSAGGMTAFNQAILTGLDMIEARKKEYIDTGVEYYRPWLFVLTDGVPTDDSLESEAKTRLHEAIRGNKVVFMPMGIGNADIGKLQEYYPPENDKKLVLKAEKDHFKEAFVWLSNSLSVIGRSNPESGSVSLPPMPGNIVVGI